MAKPSGQQAAFVNALGGAEALSRVCPECKNNKFYPCDGFFHLSLKNYTKSKDRDTGKSLVVGALLCNHCGFVKLFSTAKLGILYAEDPK